MREKHMASMGFRSGGNCPHEPLNNQSLSRQEIELDPVELQPRFSPFERNTLPNLAPESLRTIYGPKGRRLQAAMWPRLQRFIIECIFHPQHLPPLSIQSS